MMKLRVVTAGGRERDMMKSRVVTSILAKSDAHNMGRDGVGLGSELCERTDGVDDVGLSRLTPSLVLLCFIKTKLPG